MLQEIKCEHFNEKTIKFKNGLNVVLGDNHASNSIGKSTLLAIIDFIFGGSTYVVNNSGSIKQFGIHNFYFYFLFDDGSYYFKMDTNKEFVYKCDKEYKLLEVDPLTYDEYIVFLKTHYNLTHINLKFRQMVTTYSRIWGKGNDFVSKPLKNFANDSDKENIENLLKLFNFYNKIEKVNEELKNENENRKIFNKASKYNFVKKINLTKYKNNITEKRFLDSEFQNLKSNIVGHVKDVTSIVNTEILTLNYEKEKIEDLLNLYNNKLKRIKLNLENKSYIKSKNLLKLKDFFPNVNMDKLENIEEFHNGISKILRNELKKSEKDIDKKIYEIKTQIDEINLKIKKFYNVDDNTQVIFDKLYKLSIQLNNIDSENMTYTERKEVDKNIIDLKNKLSDKIKVIYDDIELLINNEMSKINTVIYKNNNSPIFRITTTGNYTLETVSDTGTGKSYNNLLMFDLTILTKTDLSFIIHDSFLYKNIQVQSIEKLITIYNNFDKQIFISIDEIEKYSKETKDILEKKHIIKLSNNQTLFTTNWGND